MTCGISPLGPVPSNAEPELRRFLDKLSNAPDLWLTANGLTLKNDGTIDIGTGSGLTSSSSGVGLTGNPSLLQGTILYLSLIHI